MVDIGVLSEGAIALAYRAYNRRARTRCGARRMPVYEYRCTVCGRRSSRLFKTLALVVHPECPRCGASSMERLFSRPTLLRGARSDSNDLGGDDLGMDDAAMAELMPGLESGDPRSLARMTRHMSEEMGEDIPHEYEGVLNRMEAGEMPSDEEFDAIEPDDGDVVDTDSH